MKKISFFLFLLFPIIIQAQTWNGLISNIWTNPLNWTPNTVPGSGSYVTINSAPNFPQLQSNTSIGGININGSNFDFNGFSLTVGGINNYNYYVNSTFINSNISTDIVLNINNGSSGYNSTFNGCTVNDNITFNLSGTDQFLEGSSGTPDIFNGNVIFNVNGAMTVNISNSSSSQFNGNLNFNRTVAGSTYFFNAGGTIVGNFNYQNMVGGLTDIGTNSVNSTINGACTLNINNPSTSSFKMYRLKNNTSGGTINVQNSLGFDIRNDSLKVNSFTIQGYRGNAYGYLFSNKIEGNVFIEDDITNNAGYITDLRTNTFTGSTTFTIKGSNTFQEANSGAGSQNIFNGNTNLNLNSSASAYLSHSVASTYNGNLSINRTVAGYLRAFNAGGIINGNFIFNNTSSGDNDLGNVINLTAISGTINMNVNLSPIGRVEIYHLVNQTAGGKINIQNSRGFDLRNDSLKVDSLNILYYRGNSYAYFYNNQLNGVLQLADSVTYSNGYNTNIQNNTINGNTVFTVLGSNDFNESNSASPNTFNGNLTYNLNGSGSLYTSKNSKTTITGNLTVNRTVAGYTRLFATGATIGGNFSYTKNNAGASDLGQINNETTITGTINMNVTQTLGSDFSMHRVQNLTNGGSILVSNTKAPDIQKDTLLVTSYSHLGYGSGTYAYFYNNLITGDLSVSDSASFGGGYNTSIQNNTINGNTVFTVLGSNDFNESNSASPNTFNGNLTYNLNGSGSLYTSKNSKTTITGNMTVNRTVAGYTRLFATGATIGGNFSFTKNNAGASDLGQINNKTTINGTININVTQTLGNDFSMQRVQNLTNGGSILVSTTRAPDIQQDSLLVTTFTYNGYGSSTYAYFYDNQIQGDFSWADDASFGGGYTTRLRNNTITGNSTITINGANTFNDGEASNSGNTYLGDVTYTRNAGVMNIATVDTNSYAGNLTFNNTAALPINSELIKFIGNTNTYIDQLGTGSIDIQKLILNKTGDAKVTLNKRVNIPTSCSFVSGYLVSSTINPLVFPDNVNHNGASDNSHVIGCIIKKGNDIFTFPLGNGIGYHPIAITAPASTTDSFKACIILKHPSTDGYDVNLKDGSILQIAPYHYWTLEQLNGSNSETVSLGWSVPCANTVITSLPDMAVARWNGSLWNNLGNGGTTGSTSLGTVSTSSTTSNYDVFALGTTSASNSWQITSVSASNSTICAGTSTTLTGSGASTYNWQPGNLNGTSVSVSPSSTTTYTVTGTSATGCVTTATKTIIVNSLPNVTTSATLTTLCSGSSTTITASNANTYTWMPGSLSGTSITVSPTSTTTYTVTGTTTATGCTKTATRTITVNALPNVGTTTTASSICNGNSTSITGTGANTYTWQPGSLSGTTINVSPTSSTTYTVTGTNTTTGCTKTSTRAITVNALPNVGTTTTNASICAGETTSITGTGANTYSWQPGSLSGTTINVSPIITTTYTVTGTSTATGCSKTATRLISVTNCSNVLNVKLYLEGYYNGSSTMKPVLLNQGIGISATDVDTITVELRQSAPPYNLAASTQTILNTSGTAVCTFNPSVAIGNYYVVVKHRNSVETWSANPITINFTTATYDFANAITKAYGNNQKLMDPGVYALFSGDINQDATIDIFDFLVWDLDNQNFAAGFYPSDLTGDGSVDIFDFLIWNPNSQNFIGVITP